MKLATILELDKSLPDDPHERLIELHRRWGLVSEATYRTMLSIYPDYAEEVDLLSRQILHAEREAAHYSAPGEA